MTRTRSAESLSDTQKIEHIRSVVENAGRELRLRHPWLDHQDALGAGILLAACAGMVFNAWLFAQGLLAWWLCVPLAAVLASFTHEIEHDLIHLRYFRNRGWVRHLMLFAGWVARPVTPNPWRRGHVHLEHHKHPGSAKDFELRGITGGEAWSLKRLVMIGDNALAILLRIHLIPGIQGRLLVLASVALAYFPVGLAGWGCWYAFLGYHGADTLATLLGSTIHWSGTTRRLMPAVDFFTVVLVAPNVLRNFCLHFLSSNLHYAGDIQPGNTLQEAQVLNSRWLWPFQLICLNFGATHSIHHFVVGEPFYIREWTAPTAHRVMREMGVRFNDFGTFRRANRYQLHGNRQSWNAPRTRLAPERQTAAWRYT